MAKKNPSTRWFFNDWHNDDALQICTLAARGAWIELLTICAENDGYILIHGKAPTITALARYVGATPSVMGRLLKELETNAVFSRTEDGVIFNRRMTRAHVTRAHTHHDPRAHIDNHNIESTRVDDDPQNEKELQEDGVPLARNTHPRALSSKLSINPLNPPKGGLHHNRNRKRKKNGSAPPEANPPRGADYGPSGASGVSWEAVVDDWFRAKAEHRRPFWHQMWTSPPPDRPGCEAPPEIIRSAHKRWFMENEL